MTPRNLFRKGTAESMDDNAFLALFGAEALEIFNPDEVWAQMQIIRSSRGGGKTSLLRIFSPRSLHEIKKREHALKPLVDKLIKLGVLLDNREINMLGVSLSLSGIYPVLEHLDLKPSRQRRLFFALLASKIVISALRNLCELKKAKFPDDLNRIRIDRPLDPNIRVCVPVPCDGERLYDWAAKMEDRVYAIIEDQSGSDQDLGGCETLSIIHLIQSFNLSYDGERVADKTLLMLDDVDKLPSSQRKELGYALANLRVPLIWMAERLEALRPEELLSPEGTDGREWGHPLIVERFWRQKRYRAKFVSLLKAISDKRAGSDDPNADFASMLLETLPPGSFKKAIKEESARLIGSFGARPQYKEWFDKCQNWIGSEAEKATQWRLLEIRIEREKRRKQRRLFPDAAPPVEPNQSSSTKHVANFYVRNEHKIPYYYGFENLAKMSSCNVEQFLDLASSLFDEITNARIADGPAELTPGRQEEILKWAAERRYKNMLRIVNDQSLENFLDTMADFCVEETKLPNAPYDSVTGVAISLEDLKLLQELPPDDRSKYGRLAGILSTCFAHNILEPRPDSRQGSPGSTHLVMYLNRIFCIHYGLPLAYGGWREKSLSDLYNFTHKIRSRRMLSLDHDQSRLEESHA